MYYYQGIELMLVDAMLKANDYLQIESHVEDPSQYWKVYGALFNIFMSNKFVTILIINNYYLPFHTWDAVR